MKALTIKEVIEQLTAAVAGGKVRDEDWVVIQGCDCSGYVDAVIVETDERFVPRVPEYDGDGMFVTEYQAPGNVVRLLRMGRGH